MTLQYQHCLCNNNGYFELLLRLLIQSDFIYARVIGLKLLDDSGLKGNSRLVDEPLEMALPCSQQPASVRVCVRSPPV